MYNSFMYMIANDGVDTENSYPYKARVSATFHTLGTKGRVPCI